MGEIVLRGKGETIAVYNLKEDAGFDAESFNLADKMGQKEFYEAVKERIDAKEFFSLTPLAKLQLIEADSLEAVIKDKTCSSDDLNLKPVKPDEILKFENLKEGDILYIQRDIGEGEYIFETDSDIDKDDLKLDYIECIEGAGTVLNEDFENIICDSVLIDKIEVQGGAVQESSTYFKANITEDIFYLAKFDPEAETLLLERIDAGGERVVNTDCYIDDFEKN